MPQQELTLEMLKDYAGNPKVYVNLPPFIFEERHSSVMVRHVPTRNHYSIIEVVDMLSKVLALSD